MALEVACPSCGKSIQVNDATAKRGKCESCGEVFAIAQTPKKVCCVCGVDVSGQKRTKDANGNYYCQPCLKKREQDKFIREMEGLPEAESYVCAACGRHFPVDQVSNVDGRIFCVLCELGGAAKQQELVPVAPQPVTFECSACKGRFPADQVYDAGGHYICHGCYAAQQQRTSQGRPSPSVGSPGLRALGAGLCLLLAVQLIPLGILNLAAGSGAAAVLLLPTGGLVGWAAWVLFKAYGRAKVAQAALAAQSPPIPKPSHHRQEKRGGFWSGLWKALTEITCPNCGQAGRIVRTREEHRGVSVRQTFDGRKLFNVRAHIVVYGCTHCGHQWEDVDERETLD